ncbi:MAG: HD domain-containing protein [Fimbriimonadaceae bacterium]|nr:HD domain-containing protein [Fimbriimonadaceae bacterium]
MSESAFPHLHRALRFALEAHMGQDRDGENPLPYITHPFEVVNTLRYIGNVTNQEILCAAALHDLLEETSATREGILAAFGTEVLNLVQEVTRHEPSTADIQGLSKDEIWVLRTRIFMDEIRKMSERAWLIKLGDRYSNLGNAFYTRTPEKLERYVWQSMMILEIIPKRTNAALWQGIQEMIDRLPVSEKTRRRLAL